MHRHSTSDSRRPAAITRHPSLVTCHFPLCILHYALCIVLAAPAAASAETALYFNGSTYFNLNRWFNALKGDLSMSAWIRVSPNIFTVNPHNTSGTAYYGAGIVGQGYYGAETGFGILANGGANTPEKAVNKNVTSLLPNAQQIGWIAGALAGLMTETGTIAFIGGMELDTTKAKYAGYAEAAAYVGEKAGKTVKTLDIVYSNSFSASDKGIEFAKAFIDQGADVFFGDASAVDSGARQAIDEANKAAGAVKIFDIAQPADILGQNECIICSQVTDNSSLVGLSMQAVVNGTFGGEVIYGTLQNGALSAGRISDLVPADVQAAYQGYLDQMVADTFMK